MTSRPAPLPALTSLRFFAAMHVLLFHFAQSHVAWAPAFVQTLIKNGNTGVTFFFVLSGFILGYNYLGREIKGLDFWRRRFARIYPVYLLSLLVALPFFIMEERSASGWKGAAESVLTQAPAKLTMLHAWFPNMVLKWNGPSWSLSVEALFYALFPALAMLVTRLNRAGAVVGIALSLGAVHVAHLGVLPLPLASLPLFALGISLAQLHRFAKPSPWLAPVALLLLLGILGNLPWIENHFAPSACLMAAAFGMVVYGFAQESRSPRLLSSPRLILLGEASYSLYILHEPIASLFQAVGIRLGGLTMANPALFGAYVIAAVATSMVVYRHFELPVHRLLVAKKPIPAESPALAA